MMSGLPVRIAVVFRPGEKAKPVWFELNRKQHKIARTTYYCWAASEGSQFAARGGD